LAKTPRTWTGARTPSGLKRVRQAERRHAILQPRRTAAKTYVASALTAATTGGDAETAATALSAAHAALDRAAKTGAIHPNAAARRKSRLTLKFNAATGGVAVTSGRVVKTTSKAQAAKAAKARIAAGKANKAKGAQTAAGKARAAVSKTARAEAAAAATAAANAQTSTTPAAKAAVKKPAATKKTPAKATAAKANTTKATAKKAPAKKAAAKS
jgi:ribosomal protein S20